MAWGLLLFLQYVSRGLGACNPRSDETGAGPAFGPGPKGLSLGCGAARLFCGALHESLPTPEPPRGVAVTVKQRCVPAALLSHARKSVTVPGGILLLQAENIRDSPDPYLAITLENS